MSPDKQLLEDNPWSEYRRLVLKNLESLDESVRALETKMYSNMEEAYLRLNEEVNRFNTSLAKLDKELCQKIASNTNDITKLQVKAGFIGAVGGVVMSAIVQVILLLVKH